MTLFCTSLATGSHRLTLDNLCYPHGAHIEDHRVPAEPLSILTRNLQIHVLTVSQQIFPAFYYSHVVLVAIGVEESAVQT